MSALNCLGFSSAIRKSIFVSINNVLVDDFGVYIGETHVRIIKLSQVVLMYRLLDLVPEALGDHFVGVDKRCRFVVNDKFALLLG